MFFRDYYDGSLENNILLLEEPGLFLHPRGKKDLLIYLEELSKSNQVIYTTHSPYSLNRLANFRIRVISKTKTEGTKVDLKPFRRNWKALRDSLGMVLGDSFYYADKNLLVEGSSDKLYLTTLLIVANKLRVTNADLNLLSILDSGGCSNVPTMAQLVHSEGRPFAILLDSDGKADEAYRVLERRKILDEKDNNEKSLVSVAEKVFRVKKYKKGALTIEDLLPLDFYRKAVNEYIEELVSDQTIEGNIKTYNTSAKYDRLNRLKKWLSEKFQLEKGISKLNIARHFDILITNELDKSFLDKVENKNDDIEKYLGNTTKLLRDISSYLEIELN